VIEAYLAELRRRLPRLGRGRIVAEVEDHLREAARERGEEQAIADFGPPDELARAFAPRAAARLAALVVLPLLAYPLLTYPIVESSLPPAPWPDSVPAYLAWKRDVSLYLWAASLVAGVVVLIAVRRGGRVLLAAVVATVAALVPMAVLQLVLAVQWADAVPGTPRWLLLVPVLELVLVTAGAGLVGRALVLTRTARS
jgi:hypothetical protein